MKSTKSASGSARQHKWRLSKTLKRKPGFRYLDEGDLQYLWAAYKKGALAPMGADIEDGEMDAAAFKAWFAEKTLDYDAAWTLTLDGKKYPIGVVFGFWPHRADVSPYMIVGEMIWFPWVSARNKTETAVNFFNEMRKEWPFVEYAALEDKAFFEMIAKHGIMRRVGTSHSIYPGQKTSVFETIMVK